MSDDVARLERELEQARVAKDYDEAVEVYRSDPSDENKARKDELANQVASLRQAGRLEREAYAAEVAEGDGVARPEPVAGTSGMNEEAPQ